MIEPSGTDPSSYNKDKQSLGRKKRLPIEHVRTKIVSSVRVRKESGPAIPRDLLVSRADGI